MLDIILIDGFGQLGIGAGVDGAGTSLGDAGDVVLHGIAALNGFQRGSFAVGRRPAGEVNELVVNIAHEGHLTAILPDQFGGVVGLHVALPHIDAHGGHDGNQIGAVGIGVVHDEFHAVALIVAVDLLIGLQEEVLKHRRTKEGVLFTAPVVVAVSRTS